MFEKTELLEMITITGMSILTAMYFATSTKTYLWVDLNTFIPHSPRLSYDVLYLCFTHIMIRKDVSSLMRTCKTLFGSGIPHLLAKSVWLYTAKNAQMFLHFMFSKSFRALRFQSLRSLRVGFWTSRMEQFQILVSGMSQVLRLALNLQKLELSALDLFCNTDLSFFDAITTLPSLRKLCITNSESKIMHLLSTIRSPLQELDVSFCTRGLELLDPLPHLGNLSSTLTTLSLRWVNLHHSNVRCSSVRYLTIETIHRIDATVLVRSFPALITLSIESLNERSYDAEADEVRVWNQGNLMSTNQWTTLLELNGEAVELYTLGLACPIRTLRMSSIKKPNLGVVQSLLDSHRPQHVRMGLSPSTFLSPWINAREMLRKLNLSCTHLSINLYSTKRPIDSLLVRHTFPIISSA